MATDVFPAAKSLIKVSALFQSLFAFGINTVSTGLDFRYVTSETRWVDDPESQYYNTWQEGDAKRDWNSAETLIRDFAAGNTSVAILIEHNGNGLGTGEEVEPYGGSAIFLCGRNVDLEATSGDVYISAQDMNMIINLLDKQLNPVIIIE